MTPPKEHPPFDPARARRRLLRWYATAKRDLPWRRTSDPYRIWLSEVMLQQTRVEAVIPYYENFLRQFPAVSALARAPQEHVLAAWSGLGYYSRARNLQRAAQQMVTAHGGKFPREPAAALALPGVGRYTAAAILSIAYGVPLAVLDGNVARVLARLYAAGFDVRDTRGRAALWTLAEELLEPRRPGDFNQAMMELGATVCLPRQPRCELCPLRQQCRAHLSGRVAEFPPPRTRTLEHALRLTGAVVRDAAGRFLLTRRPADANWMAGFWEIPTWETEHSESGNGNYLSRLRARLELGRSYGEVRHSITRFRICVEVREAVFADNGRPPRESATVRWESRGELRQLPVTTITRKALRLIEGEKR